MRTVAQRIMTKMSDPFDAIGSEKVTFDAIGSEKVTFDA